MVIDFSDNNFEAVKKFFFLSEIHILNKKNPKLLNVIFV